MSEVHIADFPKKLKESTSLPHEQLEALPISAAIVSPGVTLHEYTKYLALMHDVVKDAEENIFPALKQHVPDLAHRSKALLIENDLKHFGAEKTGYTKPLSKGNTCTPAFAMGILYVIEGSTLGGRVILKNLNKALGIGHDSGAAYFNGYGENTGPYWKNFMGLLTGYEKQNGAGDEIISGAAYAFTAIKEHFTING